MTEQKLLKFLPKIAPKVTTHFLHNIDVTRNSQKVTKLFGLILWDNLLPELVKNRPIWSHCWVGTSLKSLSNKNNQNQFRYDCLLRHVHKSLTYLHSRLYPSSTQQCDQMARLFFNIWPFTSTKTCPMTYKFGPNFSQKVNKPSENCPRLWISCPNGKIWPNLVTLLLITPMQSLQLTLSEW